MSTLAWSTQNDAVYMVLTKKFTPKCTEHISPDSSLGTRSAYFNKP